MHSVCVYVGEGNMKLHCCVAAYVSDYAFLGTALLPYPSYRARFAASLDHAMWFHSTFRSDEWMLYECESPWAGQYVFHFLSAVLHLLCLPQHHEQAFSATGTERPSNLGFPWPEPAITLELWFTGSALLLSQCCHLYALVCVDFQTSILLKQEKTPICTRRSREWSIKRAHETDTGWDRTLLSSSPELLLLCICFLSITSQSKRRLSFLIFFIFLKKIK